MGQSGPSLPYSLLAPVAPASHRGRLAAPRIRAWRVASRCAKPKFRASPISLTAWKAPPPSPLSLDPERLLLRTSLYYPSLVVQVRSPRAEPEPTTQTCRALAAPLSRPNLISRCSRRASALLFLPYCCCPTLPSLRLLPCSPCPSFVFLPNRCSRLPPFQGSVAVRYCCCSVPVNRAE